MDPSLIIALAALLTAPIGGYFALRKGKGDQKVTVEANLTVGQQAFIDRLDKANIEQLARIAAMTNEIDALKRELYELKVELAAAQEKVHALEAMRAELEDTRADLEEEREARRAGENAGKRRQQISDDRIEALNGSLGLSTDEKKEEDH